jgi:hypothetical protein
MSATNKLFLSNVAITGTETILDSSQLLAMSLTTVAARRAVHVALKLSLSLAYKGMAIPYVR